MSNSFKHGKYKKSRTDNWLRNEPKEWRRYYKHKKRRASCKECEHQILIGNLDILWPLDKKPWIYYW